jgi:hypothetical protein
VLGGMIAKIEGMIVDEVKGGITANGMIWGIIPNGVFGRHDWEGVLEGMIANGIVGGMIGNGGIKRHDLIDYQKAWLLTGY